MTKARHQNNIRKFALVKSYSSKIGNSRLIAKFTSSAGSKYKFDQKEIIKPLRNLFGTT